MSPCMITQLTDVISLQITLENKGPSRFESMEKIYQQIKCLIKAVQNDTCDYSAREYKKKQKTSNYCPLTLGQLKMKRTRQCHSHTGELVNEFTVNDIDLVKDETVRPIASSYIAVDVTVVKKTVVFAMRLDETSFKDLPGTTSFIFVIKNNSSQFYLMSFDFPVERLDPERPRFRRDIENDSDWGDEMSIYTIGQRLQDDRTFGLRLIPIVLKKIDEPVPDVVVAKFRNFFANTPPKPIQGADTGDAIPLLPGVTLGRSSQPAQKSGVSKKSSAPSAQASPTSIVRCKICSAEAKFPVCSRRLCEICWEKSRTCQTCGIYKFLNTCDKCHV